MAYSRHEVFVEASAYPWEALIGQMNPIFREISDIFFDEKMGFKNCDIDLFNIIQKALNQIQPDCTVQELDAHYTRIAAQLTHVIWQSHWFQMQQTEARKLIFYFVELYFALAKYRSLLLQFQKGEDSRSILDAIQEIKKKCDFAHQELAAHHQTVDDSLSSLQALVSSTILALNEKGYVEAIIDFDRKNNFRGNDHYQKTLSLIHKEITLLPPCKWIKKITETLNKALHDKDSKNIHRCKVEFMETMEILQSVEKNITKVIAAQIQEQNDLLTALAERNECLKETFSHLESQNKLRLLFQRILAIKGCSRNDIVLYKGYKELQNAIHLIQSVMPKKGSVKEKTNQLHQSIKNLAQNLELFVSPYLQYTDEVNCLSEQIQAITNRSDQLDSLQMNFSVQLVKIKHAWQSCHDAINAIQIILACDIDQAETDKDYFISFFLHHWWKMLIGVTSGSGSGIALSALRFALDPVSTGVLVVAGALLGFGTSGAIGWSADILHSKKNEEEKELFIKKMPEKKNVPHSSFWKKPKLLFTVLPTVNPLSRFTKK